MKAQGRDELEQLLWMALFSPAPNGRIGLPFVLVGDPGSAKTSILREIAKMAGLHFEGVISSLRQPTDFLGLPFKVEDETGVHVHYAPPNFAIQAARAGNSLLLLDEVNTTPPAVQASLLRLLFEGVCGELQLPPTVRMMLAMNETDDAAGGWDIALPLCNRVGWIKWIGPDVSRFQNYILAGGGVVLEGKARRVIEQIVDPIDEHAQVAAQWPKAWAKAAGLMSGFLSARPSNLHCKPSEVTADSRAYASPRSLEYAVAAMAGCEIYDLGLKAETQAVEAFVGDGIAIELFNYRKQADLPDPELWLDGNAEFKHDSARLDRTVAMLAAGSSFLSSSTAAPDSSPKSQRVDKLWEFIESLPDSCIDLVLPGVETLVKAKLVVGRKTAYKVLARIHPITAASGYMVEA